MEHFVRIVMEKQEGAQLLDESIFAEQEIYETEQGATVYEIALPRQLSEDEADEYANKLANYMFEQGYDDFDIEISMNEAYIKTRKDAVEALGRLRGIGKKIETGRDTFDGNLANMYVSDVYDVYSWMDSKLGISGMNDPKLKQVLDPVMELRGEAKKLETKPGSGENARFGNKIVNVLYPLMVYIEDHMEEPKEAIEEETYDGDDFFEEYGVMWYNDDDEIDEAEYQGRKVKLGKPMRGDVKKFKVYVKDPKTGNVKKVNFGDPNMKIKKSNPARRRSFRARHNCDNPGPRTKARYWSCRKW